MKIDLGVRGSEDAINHILLRVNNDFILQEKKVEIKQDKI